MREIVLSDENLKVCQRAISDTFCTVRLKPTFGELRGKFNAESKVQFKLSAGNTYYFFGIVEPSYNTWHTCVNNGDGVVLDFCDNRIRLHNKKVQNPMKTSSKYEYFDGVNLKFLIYENYSNYYYRSILINDVFKWDVSEQLIEFTLNSKEKSLKLFNMKNKKYVKIFEINDNWRLSVSVTKRFCQLVKQTQFGVAY